MKYKNIAAIAISVTSLYTTSVFSYNDYQLSCDTNITSELLFANNQLMVKSTQQEEIVFTSGGLVSVNGKPVKLTPEERKLTLLYFKEVEASIPIVVDITVEALQITDMALTEVFKGLLGNEAQLPQTLSVRINGITTAIKDHVYQDPKSLTFNSMYLKNDLGVGSELNEEIGKIKEEVVSTIMGQVIVAVGKSMLSGGGNFAELQGRMETLGSDLEAKAQELAKGLEDKSTHLCDKIKLLDDTETTLNQNDALRYLNTITFNKRS